MGAKKPNTDGGRFIQGSSFLVDEVDPYLDVSDDGARACFSHLVMGHGDCGTGPGDRHHDRTLIARRQRHPGHGIQHRG